jgi:GTPase SAR1 family protein
MNSKSLPQYLSSSQIIFIVYDVTNPESFANVDDWLRIVNEYASTARLHLVGNKVPPSICSLFHNIQVDLIANRRVSKQEHDSYLLNTSRFESGFFMSAKTGENVVKAFYKVLKLFTPLLSRSSIDTLAVSC